MEKYTLKRKIKDQNKNSVHQPGLTKDYKHDSFDVFLVTNYFRFLILQKFSDFQNNTKEKYGHKAV